MNVQIFMINKEIWIRMHATQAGKARIPCLERMY